MLSLDKLKAVSAAAAADYFLDMDRAEDVGDYYIGEDGQPERAKAVVLGKLGRKLGLDGSATYEQFLHLLDGRHPLTGERVRRWQPNGVAAIDMTASAPKSVSVLWAVGDAELRRQVQAAQDKAVTTMLAYIEQSFDVVLRWRQRTEKAESVVAVSFAHHTSRQTAEAAGLEVPPDPQLHTHVLLMMAQRKDGRVVSIGNQDVVWKRRAEAMAVYHAELAAELAKLGFAIERHTGRGGHYFEVAGIPRELCDIWSTRRKEISEWLETWSAEFRRKYGRDPDMVELRDPEAVNLFEAPWAGFQCAGPSVVAGFSFLGCVAGEQVLAVVAAEQEDEAVQVVAQLPGAVGRVADLLGEQGLQPRVGGEPVTEEGEHLGELAGVVDVEFQLGHGSGSVGLLIHAADGSFGGCGRSWTNRSGWAAQAAASTPARAAWTSCARP